MAVSGLYGSPIIVHDAAGHQKALSVHRRHPQAAHAAWPAPPTMDARAETVGQLRSYKSSWAKVQLCPVPMRHFFEPNWEQEKHGRWSIGMAGWEPFAVARLYIQLEEDGGTKSNSFTQLTINADAPPPIYAPLPSPRRGKALTGHRPERRLR
jgi:putative SOS response-associated peptidase YedK